MLHSSDIYFGITARAARELAYQYAHELKIKFPDSWVEHERAGRYWLDRFMNAHPKLSFRKPEATSLARASAFNPVNVARFFDQYDQVTQYIEFTPNNIFNVDECGLTTVHKPDRVISRRGRKQVGRITAAERGTVVSMALAVCANGTRVPPFLIFPRARFQPHFINGGPVGCVGGANPSGYMNGENFLEFIKHFHNYTRCSPEKPVLLLLDNHESHRTLDVIKYCRANGIHMLSFPPHCSHRMQPLDVSVFGPFKKAANTFCSDWVKMNPGRVTQITDLSPIFAKALIKGACEENIMAGFEACGLWPLNRQRFGAIDFMPSETTDRPYTDAELIMDDDLPMAEDIELPLEFEDGFVFEPFSFDRTLQVLNESTLRLLDVSTPEPMQSTSNPMQSTSKSVQSTSNPSTPDRMQPTSPPPNFANILQSISPFPKAPPRKTARRGRQPGKSTILTADESIEEIEKQHEDRHAKKSAAEAKKKATAEKKVAAAEKKSAIAAKKLATAAKKKPQVKRLANQRKSVADELNYAEMSDSE